MQTATHLDTHSPVNKTRAAAGKALAVFVAVMIVLTLANSALNELTIATVDTVNPQRGALEKRIEGSGQLAALSILPVYAEAAVHVTQVHVSAGEQVTKGAPLFTLDAAELADLTEEARRKLDEATQTYDDAVQALAWAKADMSKTALERYTNAQAKVDRAQAAYDLAVAENASVDTLERRENTLKAAIRTRDRISSVRTYFTKETELAQAELALKDAQEDYENQQRIGGASGTVYAPLDGEVLEVSLATGDTASTEKAALTLAGLDGQLELRITVSEDDAGELAIGDEAEITLGSETSSQKIASIAASTENKGKFDICFKLDSRLGRVGMNGKMMVRKRTQQYDTLVPYSALRQDNTGYFVYVITERDSALGAQTTVSRADVTVLDQDGRRAAVQGGVSQRDLIVSRGDRDITAGDRVRIQED